MPLDTGQWVYPNKPGILWKVASQSTICAVFLLAKFWIHVANKIQIHNKETVQKEVKRCWRERRPLLTVSNHTSCADDLTLCATLKFRHIKFGKHFKWTPGASEIAYLTTKHSYFFTLGQIVPVLRGDGVYQQGMDLCVEKLNDMGWSHIYAEGGVNMTDEFMRLKWGVGRLISECKVVPTVVPMWHVGMEEILHNYPPYYPRFNKKVTMVIGQPLDFREMVEQMKADFLTPLEMRKKLTDVIQEEMRTLRTKALALHAAHTKR